MKKKMTPYILLVPQLILGVVFIIGLGTGIIQSLGVIPALDLDVELTLKMAEVMLTRPDLLQSLKYSLYIVLRCRIFSAGNRNISVCSSASAGKRRTIMDRLRFQSLFPMLLWHSLL